MKIGQMASYIDDGLSGTADWRAVSEEIWPLVQGSATTPIGEAEAA